MHLHDWKQQCTVATATVTSALILMTGEAAMAHGGHEHAAKSGFDTTAAFQVGGVVAVLGIAYLLASRVYRRRENADADRGDWVDPSSR